MTRTAARLPHLAAALLAGALVLAGCGEGSSDAAGHGSAGSGHASASSTDSAEATHDDADIAFASGMVPHHESATEMAQLAPGRTADPRVLDLASGSRPPRARRSMPSTAGLPSGAPRVT